MNIVCVAACTAGIAHTYIAREKLIKGAKALGHNVKKLADAGKRQIPHTFGHSAFAIHAEVPGAYGLTGRRLSVRSPSMSTPSCL